MVNVLTMAQDIAGTTMGQDSIQDLKPKQSGQQLLQQLSQLSEVALWRVHWCLSQNLLPDCPPIPLRWLHSADASRTAKTMMLCYHEDRALQILAAVLNLMGPEHPVCHIIHSIRLSRPTSVPKLVPQLNPDSLRTLRRRLISRIQKPDIVLTALLHNEILDSANQEALMVYALRKDKNRALVDLVLRKGREAQQAFYQALSQSEPFMLEELKDDQIKNKGSTEPSDLMLESLVSEELRCFQWIVKDYLPPENVTNGNSLDADWQTTKKILEQQLGHKQAEIVIKKLVLKIVPVLCVHLEDQEVTSLSSPDIRMDVTAPLNEITPEVQMNGSMFRLHCQISGIHRCLWTDLVLEGFGDVVYEMVPWDVDFLSSKGLRPAGPLFRFTLLTGSFHKLHLPHCQLLSGKLKHSLSVAHITRDHVDYITPGQVTDSHVIFDILGFSCFGLVTSRRSSQAIRSLVLLFSQPSNSAIFVLLLPRNVCLAQVRKEWKRRIGAQYIETIPDCKLVPNQMYKLTGEPVTIIQPESSKFINFSDYNNFLPSFEVWLPDDITMVTLKLKSHVTDWRLIGWLFGPTDCEVWSRTIQLPESVSGTESADLAMQLFNILSQLSSEDMKVFQHLLTLQPDPIPISRLEDANRIRTVSLMVQQYYAEGAKGITEDLLRMMKQNQLADELQKI
ncbi:uncharacterized protein LOC108228439 isoform X2 [Kryptolebias marmoratus]|nr:uncharacterized protein LOC108228439 isoform X2 [Kryptolebias marmoratus]